MYRSIVASVSLMLCSFAHAGIYSDDMARCLVSATSTADKANLVRWMFAKVSRHPDVASIVAISDDRQDELDRSIAALFERLVTDACRKQSEEAFKYEGAMAFQQSFGVLGQVAMQELMSNKSVSSGFEAFTKYLDKTKFEALGIK